MHGVLLFAAKIILINSYGFLKKLNTGLSSINQHKERLIKIEIFISKHV